MLKALLNYPLQRGLYLLAGLLFISTSALAQFSVTVEGTNVECFGLGDGTATATPSGGATPYSYLWSNGGTTQTITNLNTGVYRVTVTDNGGQTATGSVELTQPTRIEADFTEPTQCTGPYTVAVEPRGGVPPYRYSWTGGQTSRTVVVPAGSYCVTVVDDNLCGRVFCTDVEDNPIDVIAVAVDARCADSNDGSVSASPSGGVPPYSYRWSNGGTSQVITNLPPRTYMVTVTDSRGCSASAFATVDAPPQLTGEIFGDRFSCAEGGNAFIRIAPSGGTPPYTYAWSTGSASQGLGSLGPGTYSVTVTDANGCTITDTYTIGVAPDVDIEIVGDSVLCGAGTTGTLTVSPRSGSLSDYTYEWSTGATGPTITNVGPGTYSVTATSEFFCTDVATATVRTVDLDLDVTGTNVRCAGDNDGTATATVTGGTLPYTYQWSTGASTATITGLAPGVYSVTVTEASGCKASGSVRILSPSPLRLTGQTAPTTCAGNNDGLIDVTVRGGTPGYTYNWDDGSTEADRSGLAAGTYCLTVTDASGCTDDACFTVSEPGAIDVDGTVTDLACFGGSTGRIDLSVSGGTPAYTYRWSTGATTRSLTNLAAGTYQVTVTDANGCTAVAGFTLTQPSEVVLSGTVSDVDCSGDTDGAIDVSVSGGTPGYRYRWNDGVTTADRTGLAPGTYSLTVTDANGCSDSGSFTVGAPPALSLNGTITNVDCNGAATGAIDVTAAGGTAPYTYDWADLAGTNDPADRSGLRAGNYVLTLTDANGCRLSRTFIVRQPAGLNVTGTTTPVACLGDSSGTINVTVTGGTPPYTYAWNTGATTQDLSGLSAGTYTVTVTDARACTQEQSFTVGSNTAITVTGDPIDAQCNGEATGGVDITVSGGDAPYTFRWSNGTTREDLANVAAGDYSVTVTDASGCTAVADFTVDEPNEFQLNPSTPLITCGGTSTGTIILDPRGGTPPYTFRFSNGDTGRVVTNLPAGNYSITVTDANGCTAVTDGIVLSELPQLECEIVVDQEPTTGNNGALTVNADGGTQPYTYAWSNGATTRSITGLAAGTYSATVTDANGCTTSCTATLRALAGIGDFVWLDQNADGQQDPGEPGIADFPVFLKDADGNIIDSTRTDSAGQYSFVGLEPGTYSILFDAPDDAIATALNAGDDASDSDADPAMGGMTRDYVLDPGEFDMTVDAGFFTRPGGAISDPCNCLNNNTNDDDGQFSETLEVRADPGQTWTIVAQQNMFLDNGIDPPVAPTPVPLGTRLEEIEPGVYAYEFRLVDELTYTVTVSNGVFEISLTNTCVYPTLRFAVDPPAELCRFEAPLALAGTASIPGDITFTVNGVAVTELDPANLPLGTITIEGQLIPDDEEECIVNISRDILIIDDCNAKLGDLVFLDRDGDGIQDPGEEGIGGVRVIVTSQDGTYSDTTVTDGTGMYMFSVPPGTYKMTFASPGGLLQVSPPNQGGDDARDSDVDPTTLMTPFYTVGPDEMDLTIDAGFFNPCIDNVDDPGTIGFDQTVCGPGATPDPFVELTPAVGGVGELEYLWMMNTEDPNQRIEFWTPIPNTNSPTYAPGPVAQTTYFTRCVRRDDCPYIESNVVEVLVGNDAVANINAPRAVCVGQNAVFQAANSGAGARVTWNFSGTASVTTSNSPVVNVSWATFGNFSVTLTVVRNGCTSTQVGNITVTNNPSRCGGNLVANGTVNDLQQRDVTIRWSAPADGSEYDFALERSTDGATFATVAEAMAPVGADAGAARYRVNDVSPLAGRTFYRVRLRDAEFGDLLSNVVEMQLAPATAALGRVFPNPASAGMLHIELTETMTSAATTSAELFDLRGNRVANRVMGQAGSGIINFRTEGLAAGVYILRLKVGDEEETHRVILE